MSLNIFLIYLGWSSKRSLLCCPEDDSNSHSAGFPCCGWKYPRNLKNKKAIYQTNQNTTHAHTTTDKIKATDYFAKQTMISSKTYKFIAACLLASIQVLL
jgi:hypothetical protein